MRIDGEFELVRARSVPRQLPPYRPLAEVVADQHVFELRDSTGTLVGFRFPDYAAGLEVDGYHLHFITADRDRAATCSTCRAAATASRSSTSRGELHVELPPGVELDDSPQLDEATRGGARPRRAQG